MEKILDNRTFWNERYTSNPELGSGLGSRGEILEYKKNLIQAILMYYSSNPILDIGFGDLELMKDFDLCDYTGVDLSDVAVEKAKNIKPKWKFYEDLNHVSRENNFNLVTCFDVLIHQPTREDYIKLIDAIVQNSSDAILLAGFETNPNISSEITYFYEKLSTSLNRIDSIEEYMPIGQYRDVTLFLIQKKKLNHNKNDINVLDLYRGILQSKTPQLLIDLVKESRELLTFFPKTTIRLNEYPWLANYLSANRLIQNKLIVDLGAGVSILPIYLAEKGARVTTIDSHPNCTRKKSDILNWNEWGFLDYSMFSEKIKSLNTDASCARLDEKVDIIYSISVIEHLPSNLRKKIIFNSSSLLKSGGLFLITMDLIPGKKRLWNLNEGKKVESNIYHGRLKTVLKEIENSDFKVISHEVERGVFKSRTDVAYIIAEKK